MVTMSAVWDKAVAVIAGRTAMLGSVALAMLWLPSVVQNGLTLWLAKAPAPQTPGVAGLFMVVAFVVLVLTLLGHLAMVAIASDPDTTRAAALHRARVRLLPYFGLVLLLMLIVAAVTLPALVLVFGDAANIAAMRAGAMPKLAAGTAGGLGLYMLLLTIVGIWIYARMLLFTPVVVNERRGVGSFARSFALTRGLTWRILGVALLFGIVAIVVTLAVQSVTGIVLRLALGAQHAALAVFLTHCVTSLIGAGLAVIIAAFTAQLYVATREANEPA